MNIVGIAEGAFAWGDDARRGGYYFEAGGQCCPDAISVFCDIDDAVSVLCETLDGWECA